MSATLASGELCAYSDPRAAYFCLMGAVTRVAGFSYPRMLQCNNSLYAALHKLSGDYSLACWNDHPGRTQAEVLALVDDAIALA